MNKTNAARYLPLVQALAEGKCIQTANGSKDKWLDFADDEEISFNRAPEFYRVKPEPKVIYINQFGDGQWSCSHYGTKQEAELQAAAAMKASVKFRQTAVKFIQESVNG